MGVDRLFDISIIGGVRVAVMRLIIHAIRVLVYNSTVALVRS